MHTDASIALEAFEKGHRAWVRLIPEVVEDMGSYRHLLLDAVARFESLPRNAGIEAAKWLREHALDDYGSSVTYLMLLKKRVEAFYALRSAEVLLSQHERKRLLHKRRSEAYEIHPRQPASLIIWTAKRDGADGGCAELILRHAFASAVEVAQSQGNIALVLDPYDEKTAQMWMRMKCVKFRRSAEARPSTNGQQQARRLWTPLHPPNEGVS
jgi:hypothetical protein